MGQELHDLKVLAKQVAKKQPPTNFSLADAEEALRNQLKNLAKDYNHFRRNKLTIFELIQEMVDEVLPARVEAVIGRFAETRQFAQGQKPIFKKKLGRQRARSFITRAALSAIYETFRLDRQEIEVPVYAYGGAALIELERFLDGIENIDELMDIVTVGLEEAIYREVQDALISAIVTMPAPNVFSSNTFDADEMVRLINVARAYGGRVNIFATPEFAASITPSAGFSVAGGYFGSATEEAELRNQGWIGVFRGANVIVLPQSFDTDENLVKQINPGLAYIIPSGGEADEKIVKVAMEGQTIVDDFKNADRSMEIQAYKKFGVAVLTTNYYCVYQNTSLYAPGDGWTPVPIGS